MAKINTSKYYAGYICLPTFLKAMTLRNVDFFTLQMIESKILTIINNSSLIFTHFHYFSGDWVQN